MPPVKVVVSGNHSSLRLDALKICANAPWFQKILKNPPSLKSAGIDLYSFNKNSPLQIGKGLRSALETIYEALVFIPEAS